MTSYTVSHKKSDVTLEGKFNLYRRDNLHVALYEKVILEQNEKRRALPSNLQLRIHHEDNKIISLGVENYDVLNRVQPNDLSASGLYGHDLRNGFRVFGGASALFRVSTSNFLNHRYLLGVRHRDVRATAELACNRVNTPVVIEGEKSEKSEVQKVLDVKIDGVINSTLKTGADVNYNFDTKNFGMRVYAEHQFDSSTSLRARIDNFDSLTFGLVHNYRQLINFGFVSRVI